MQSAPARENTAKTPKQSKEPEDPKRALITSLRRSFECSKTLPPKPSAISSTPKKPLDESRASRSVAFTKPRRSFESTRNLFKPVPATPSPSQANVDQERPKTSACSSQRRTFECSKDLRKSNVSPAYRQIPGSSADDYALEFKVADHGTTHAYTCASCSDYFHYDTLYCAQKKLQKKVIVVYKHFQCLEDSELRHVARTKEYINEKFWTDANFSDKHAKTILDRLTQLTPKKLTFDLPTEVGGSSNSAVNLDTVSTNMKDSLLKTAMPDLLSEKKARKTIFKEELDLVDDDDANTSTDTFIMKTVLDEDGQAFEGQSFGELSANSSRTTAQEVVQTSDSHDSLTFRSILKQASKDIASECAVAGDDDNDDDALEFRATETTITKRRTRLFDTTTRPVTPSDNCADSENYLESVKKSVRSGSFPVFSRIGTPAAPPQNSLFEPRDCTPSHSPPWLKRFSAKAVSKGPRLESRSSRRVSTVPSPIRRVSEKRKMLTVDELEPYPKMRKVSKVSKAVALDKETRFYAQISTPRNSLIYSPTKGLARMKLPEAATVKKEDLAGLLAPK